LKLTACEIGLTVDLGTKSVSEWRTIAAMYERLVAAGKAVMNAAE